MHADDLADAFILLVEEALKPNGGNASWGDDGYYFAEAGEFVSLMPPQYICTIQQTNNASEMGRRLSGNLKNHG